MDTISTSAIAKVDTELGLVFGWAIVCKVDGKDYFDVQGDHIPESAMLEATTDFAKSMIMGKMHIQDVAADGTKTPQQHGDVVFSMPMTTDVAKAFGVETKTTGWMVAVAPSPEILAKYKSGEYTGFSIGGSRIEDEAVPDG